LDTASAARLVTLHTPPVRYADLPPVGGKVGPEPEDFLVDEVPAYAASGKGEHQYVLAQKRLLTTPELARRLAKACGVNERDVGYAGLKDKYAVTSQWLSLATKTPISPELPLGDGVKILAVTRHDNKLRTGHLLGNRFSITLVGVNDDAPRRPSELLWRATFRPRRTQLARRAFVVSPWRTRAKSLRAKAVSERRAVRAVQPLPHGAPGAGHGPAAERRGRAARRSGRDVPRRRRRKRTTASGSS
jgi:hypothetical protein